MSDMSYIFPKEVAKCQDCGEENPSNGFYPMGITAILPDGTRKGPWLCNDCEKARRAYANQ